MIKVKRARVFVYLFLLFSIHSNAQKRWGLIGGAGVSSISGYNFTGIDGKTSSSLLLVLQASAFAQVPIDKKGKLILKPSFGYVPKGVQLSDVNETGDGYGINNLKRRLDYLELSVPVCFKLNSNGTVTLLGVGPYIAYAVSGRDLIDSKLGQLFGNIEKISSPVDFTKIDRLDAGVTFHFTTIFSDGWCIGLNADLGLTNIFTVGPMINHTRYAGLYFGHTF